MIDLLRCPREHEETWLVAAFNRMEGRFIVEGKGAWTAVDGERFPQQGLRFREPSLYRLELAESGFRHRSWTGRVGIGNRERGSGNRAKSSAKVKK